MLTAMTDSLEMIEGALRRWPVNAFSHVVRRADGSAD
jgi:hypothetical protein